MSAALNAVVLLGMIQRDRADGPVRCSFHQAHEILPPDHLLGTFLQQTLGHVGFPSVRVGARAAGSHLGVRARFVRGEVLSEQPGEFPGSGVVGRRVGPGLAGNQHPLGDAGAGRDDLESEDRVGRRRGGGQGAGVDRVDDRASDRQAHARPTP